jgi:hypothetical protein
MKAELVHNSLMVRKKHQYIGFTTAATRKNDHMIIEETLVRVCRIDVAIS